MENNPIWLGLMREWKYSFMCLVITGKGKGKAIPLQALTGPEGSMRLRFPDFKILGT
jgi:hypothetical protein